MREVADEKRVSELVSALTERIRQDTESPQGRDRKWALVGMRSRGDILAERLSKPLGIDRVGTLDITLYRDDLSEIGNQAVVQTTEIPFDLDGLDVLLVDDVVMSGRSVRAALDCLTDLGRPRRVWLSVLVDRGGRELPITPDHVALSMTDMADGERVLVELKPHNDKDAIVVRAPASKLASSSDPKPGSPMEQAS